MSDKQQKRAGKPNQLVLLYTVQQLKLQHHKTHVNVSHFILDLYNMWGRQMQMNPPRLNGSNGSNQ
jgi:hypothetical protein